MMIALVVTTVVCECVSVEIMCLLPCHGVCSYSPACNTFMLDVLLCFATDLKTCSHQQLWCLTSTMKLDRDRCELIFCGMPHRGLPPVWCTQCLVPVCRRQDIDLDSHDDSSEGEEIDLGLQDTGSDDDYI